MPTLILTVEGQSVQFTARNIEAALEKARRVLAPWCMIPITERDRHGNVVAVKFPSYVPGDAVDLTKTYEARWPGRPRR